MFYIYIYIYMSYERFPYRYEYVYFTYSRLFPVFISGYVTLSPSTKKKKKKKKHNSEHVIQSALTEIEKGDQDDKDSNWWSYIW